MLIINSTLLIDGDDFEQEELRVFTDMNKPFRIEGSQKAIGMLDGIKDYRKLHRTMFKLIADNNLEQTEISRSDINENPDLDSIYNILSEGFPNLLDYPLWITDTSHRIRHGISRVFSYKNTTTASIIYNIENYVLVGQVATKVSARGSGYARKLLKWLAAYLEDLGYTSFLYALDTRESFYREIGFEAYSSEYVLERNDSKSESDVKGRLTAND